MTPEALMELRGKIAEEYGFALYRRYTTQQVMGLLGMSDDSKLKRNRKAMPHVREPGGGIYYLGVHIADWLAFGEGAVALHPKVETWANSASEASPLETIGSPNEVADGSELGMTPLASRPNALLSALTAKK